MGCVERRRRVYRFLCIRRETRVNVDTSQLTSQVLSKIYLGHWSTLFWCRMNVLPLIEEYEAIDYGNINKVGKKVSSTTSAFFKDVV